MKHVTIRLVRESGADEKAGWSLQIFDNNPAVSRRKRPIIVRLSPFEFSDLLNEVDVNGINTKR